jgi:guanidinopropionase
MPHDDSLDRMQLNLLYWWGVPTLFRAPHDIDPAHTDIALIGVPHASGNSSTERDQHLGPRAVRNVSANHRRYHAEFDFMPWDACRINDLGDVPLPELNDNERNVERITEFYKRVSDAGARPVSIGGDHGITGAIVQGIAGAGSKLTGGRPAALLHLDAHTDAYSNLEHWLGAKKSAANWAAYLVHQGNVDATKSVQIGMRGNPRGKDWLKMSFDLGYEVLTMKRYRELGGEKCTEIIRNRIGPGTPLYITFDLDCLDPSVAPGVSNIEPGVAGWNVDEAVDLLRAVRGFDVIGGDVVCLMPTKDQPNNITAMVAASVMYEMVGLIAETHSRRKNTAAVEQRASTKQS